MMMQGCRGQIRYLVAKPVHAALSGALAAALLVALGHTPVRAENETVTKTGDVLQILLPAGGWGATFVAGSPEGGLWDREGTKQGLYSIGAAIATVRVWKEVAKKLRPNARSRSSFPSGHTTGAFSGAAFINGRYGWKVGIPAYAAAAFTGYSRVQADWHFADDVVAGASTAIMWSFVFVTPQSESMMIMPKVDESGVGVAVSVQGGDPGDEGRSGARVRKDGTFSPRYRYSFAFGPAYLHRNEVTAPASDGMAFDLGDFDRIDDPTTTAAAAFDFILRDRHEIELYYGPFESRDRGRFTRDVDFGGVTFPADSTLGSSWRLHDIRASWRYDLLPESPWTLRVGAGLLLQDLRVALVTEGGSVSAAVDDVTPLPFVHGEVGYWMTPRLGVTADFDGIALSTDWMTDAILILEYRLSDQWGAFAGYNYYARDIETDKLRNKVTYNAPYLSVAYAW